MRKFLRKYSFFFEDILSLIVWFYFAWFWQWHLGFSVESIGVDNCQIRLRDFMVLWQGKIDIPCKCVVSENSSLYSTKWWEYYILSNYKRHFAFPTCLKCHLWGTKSPTRVSRPGSRGYMLWRYSVLWKIQLFKSKYQLLWSIWLMNWSTMRRPNNPRRKQSLY